MLTKSLTKLSFVGRPGLGKVVRHNCGGWIALGRGCDGYDLVINNKQCQVARNYQGSLGAATEEVCHQYLINP